MSASNSINSNLQSLEVLGLITSGKYSTAVEKIHQATQQNIQIFIESDALNLAFNEVITKRRERKEHSLVIELYLQKFKLSQIHLADREGFFNSMIAYLKERKEELSKYDWNEITTLLQWQKNYLKLIGKEPGLIGQLELAIGQFIEYEKRASLNESEVEGFIQETKTSFLKALPTEESLDYAAQIILSSKSY